MRVCGIDLSSFAVDMVLVDLEHGGIEWQRFVLEGTDAWERTRRVRDCLPARTDIVWDDVLAIGIEQPAGHHGVIPLVRVQGAILATLPPTTLMQPYTPARWRVLSGLRGHALKADVKARSLELGGHETWPQDAHDAHLVARAMIADLEAQEQAA